MGIGAPSLPVAPSAPADVDSTRPIGRWSAMSRLVGQRMAGRAAPSVRSVDILSPTGPLVALTAPGGRNGRCPGGGGASLVADRCVTRTAYGLRTPLMFAPAKAASACGVQPAFNAAVTAGASLTRWAAVSRQSGPSAAKNSPTGPPPPPAASAACGPSRAGAGGSRDGSLYGSGATAAPRSGASCTPSAPVAPRSRLGVQRLHPVGPVIHSLAAGGNGVRRLHPRQNDRQRPAARPR